MRYYDLTISDPKTGEIWQTAADGSFTKSKKGTTFTSFVNGQTLPGALNVEFDFPLAPFATPQGQGSIVVWGVGLKQLAQASDLNGQYFVLRAGMQKGLPLAKPSQAGIIAQGQIYQSFGNWEGVNQTLNLIGQGAKLTPDAGVAFAWQPSTTLASALADTFSQAFPDYKQDIKVSDALVNSDTVAECGVYDNIEQFSSFMLDRTTAYGEKVTGNPLYPGVKIAPDYSTKTLRAWDDTSPRTVRQLAFEDLIGQPTWIDPGTVNFKTVLRADIQLADVIKFPAGIVSPYALTTQAAAAPGSPARNKAIFQGTFSVVEVHQFGNFRQADAGSWATTFSAVPVTVKGKS
jgi:hypothetical protein